VAQPSRDDAVNVLDAIARASPDYVEALYEHYRRDPDSVDERWILVFAGYEWGGPPVVPGRDARGPATADLIHSYRELGHLVADLEPLERNPRSQAPGKHAPVQQKLFGVPPIRSGDGAAGEPGPIRLARATPAEDVTPAIRMPREAAQKLWLPRPVLCQRPRQVADFSSGLGLITHGLLFFRVLPPIHGPTFASQDVPGLAAGRGAGAKKRLVHQRSRWRAIVTSGRAAKPEPDPAGSAHHSHRLVIPPTLRLPWRGVPALRMPASSLAARRRSLSSSRRRAVKPSLTGRPFSVLASHDVGRIRLGRRTGLPSPEHDVHVMQRAIVRERHAEPARLQGHLIDTHGQDATRGTHRVLNGHTILRRMIAKHDLEAPPCARDAWIEMQCRATRPETEEPLRTQAVHPAG
jgi:2-oxoglutarate dehydrogenase N-terminus